MIIRIMNNHNAAMHFASQWIDIAPEMKGKNEKAVSLQISWNGLVGPLTGYLKLIGANDRSNAGYKRTIEINVTDNFDDSELIVLRQIFKFLRVEYVPLGIVSGKINANIYYK
ncbi:hypothetical protein EP342_02045 [bacterium]|nr:MAG: hypothetical protein EP342_02045 [bacterium]